MNVRTHIAAAIVSLLTLDASAADIGTITVTGALKAASCVVKVNGGTADGTVALDAVSTTLLTSAGMVAGAKSFTLGLTGCDPTSAVYPYFQNTQSTISAQGRLKNTATTSPATNVELQVLNASSGVVNLSLQENLQNAGAPVLPIGGNVSFGYTIQYYATAATTAGSINSSLTYVIKYL